MANGSARSEHNVFGAMFTCIEMLVMLFTLFM